jgi:AcrR family transcriptional regulator
MATQAERTADTTTRLLDATIHALIKSGYAGASLPEVCRIAGVSRGAQLHHYPTKEDLVAAAVEHLFDRRLAELQSRLTSAGSDFVDLDDAAQFMWSVYAGDTFYAWLELVVAARSDARLRSSLAKVDARFTLRAEKLCQRFLLPFVSDAAEVKATTRLILSIFDGLAMHRILAPDVASAKRVLRIANTRGIFLPKGKNA